MVEHDTLFQWGCRFNPHQLSILCNRVWCRGEGWGGIGALTSMSDHVQSSSETRTPMNMSDHALNNSWSERPCGPHRRLEHEHQRAWETMSVLAENWNTNTNKRERPCVVLAGDWNTNGWERPPATLTRDWNTKNNVQRSAGEAPNLTSSIIG